MDQKFVDQSRAIIQEELVKFTFESLNKDNYLNFKDMIVSTRALLSKIESLVAHSLRPKVEKLLMEKHWVGASTLIDFYTEIGTPLNQAMRKMVEDAKFIVENNITFK